MLGTDFILNSLEKEGIDHLFTVPGGLIDPFLQALSKQKNLKPIVAAQEGGAAYMVLAVAKETHADFEWNDHVQHALSAGVPSEIIDKLKVEGLSKTSFPQPFQLAAGILSSTLVWKNIPEKIQANAINEYSMCGFIEIVVLSGFYQMFSAINQGFDVSKNSEHV
jgi:hypothetical protein